MISSKNVSCAVLGVYAALLWKSVVLTAWFTSSAYDIKLDRRLAIPLSPHSEKTAFRLKTLRLGKGVTLALNVKRIAAKHY